ncbi:MAG: DUF3592 domain-containing protein [Gemmatimonadetes bacterium]|nr:DUF3592 domain-containing protein [Gemmatimonadota bacterium]
MVDFAKERRLSPPPRRVPLTLSIRVVLGPLSQVGWFLVGFGLIFVWAFGADRAVVSAIQFAGDLEVVEGTTTAWRELSLSINDVSVYETSYAFEVGGQTYTGASYETGYYVPEGTRLPVEYRPSNPTVSRLKDMRASPVGLVIAFVFIIPLIGLALARGGLRGGFRARRLLSEGQLALGTLKTDESTSMQVNNKQVHRLTFQFVAEGGGTYQVVATTHEVDRLLDDAQEAIVYDPRHPADAVTLDDLPGHSVIDVRGNFEGGGLRGALVASLSLVIPTLTVVGHGVFLHLYLYR